MTRTRLSFLTVACAILPAAASAEGLVVYPAPPVPQVYTLHNDAFTVRVRQPGGAWHDLYEYRIRVDWDAPQDASMVYFDMEGPVEIEVQKNNGAFARVAAAPLSSAAKLERRDDIVRVTLAKPESFSLQFDDDRLHNLHILAGRPPAMAPSGAKVRVFGAGVHKLPPGETAFPVASGDRIYLEGGAILQGAFNLKNVRDVRITGRGLLYDPGRGIDLDGATDVEVSDLIIVNTDREAGARVMNIRNSQRVAVNAVSGFTAGKWADGFNISTSQHVAIDGAYLRTSDDAVVVYAVTDCPVCGDAPIAPVGPAGAPSRLDTFDITVTNTRIWNDVAHALYVGHFGDLTVPRVIHDVTFRNIDIANLDEDDPAWEGAMAIFSGDRTLIRNITFENIRVDRIEEGKLIHIAAGYNPRYNKQPGRGIDGVTLRNIRYTGSGMPSHSVIAGSSPTTAVRNVTVNGLLIGDRSIRNTVEGEIDVGSNVEGLTIR